jgi:hypothetical protein
VGAGLSAARRPSYNVRVDVGVGISPKQGSRRWWRRGLYASIALVTASGFGVFVYRVAVGEPLPPSAATRERLRAVPVSAAACAQVPGLHDAASRARIEMEYASAGYAVPRQNSFGLPNTPVPASWPSSRSHLDASLRGLDTTLARSAYNFPAVIQEQFSTVRRDIASGRRELAQSQSIPAMLASSSVQWNDAVQAFGSASDLVGHQCATTLGASDPLFGPCDLADCTNR